MDKTPLIYILISASLFGLSPPLAKILVENINPIVLAGLLYLGAFLGLSMYTVVNNLIGSKEEKERALEKQDIPWLAGAIIAGGVLGPITLMMGLKMISGFVTSLLLNLEGLTTGLIAVLIFKEDPGKRIWLALIAMSIAGILLSWNPQQGTFNIIGPLLIVFAMICWGIDNNLTRNISQKNPVHIAAIKGIVAGSTSIGIALLLGNSINISNSILFALILGAFSYGVSLVMFIKALEGLGSFRTGLFFSLAPFIGAVASLILFDERIELIMIPAVILMVLGVYFVVTEKHAHTHDHVDLRHSHYHTHDDPHHDHIHEEEIPGGHIHEHSHEDLSHTHLHWPDSHHRHDH